MNIFVTNPSPVASAENLDDKRVIKMILESAQMLSAAMHVHGAPNPPYKITHKNHPCTMWARQNKQNYRWLMDHFNALCIEYYHRYGKIHKCFNFIDVFIASERYMPDGEITPFVNCSLFKDVETVSAYRLTMISKWTKDEENKRKPKWTGLGPPTWFTP